MEPITLTTVATVIAAIFFTKVIEKPGENLGQLLWDKTQNLMARLKGTPSKIAGLLEGSPEQPLDIGEAVLELKALADQNPELVQAIKDVEAEVERNPNIAKQVQILAQAMQSQSPTVQNSGKLAEYIKNLFQGNNFFGPVTLN